MRYSGLSWVVALDGGTSNTRARLLHDGRVVATSRRPVGVRDAVAARAGEPLLVATRDVIRDVLTDAGGVRPDAIVAAGMLTSEVGLAEVPHVPAPAGVDDLARAAVPCDIPQVAHQPILLVPGVRTPPGAGPDGWAAADLMRGEECESLGVRPALGVSGPVALLWPGSHTKLVGVDAQGRVARSVTTLAGELTAALARHTILAASLPEKLPDDPDPASVRCGARVVAAGGLGRAAFLVRVSAVNGTLTPDERAAFWVGAVVADDAAHLARHPILGGPVPLWVGGPQPLRGLYTVAVSSLRDGPVSPLSDDDAETASALGALAVARRWFETRAAAGR